MCWGGLEEFLAGMKRMLEIGFNFLWQSQGWKEKKLEGFYCLTSQFVSTCNSAMLGHLKQGWAGMVGTSINPECVSDLCWWLSTLLIRSHRWEMKSSDVCTAPAFRGKWEMLEIIYFSFLSCSWGCVDLQNRKIKDGSWVFSCLVVPMYGHI